uniref:Uncharacterized protein n=1 Tax=Meloidogyne enterolobii TaxID=390850 RepID=A0A6V7U5J4_MELEN|nr:unnamed protein product [Meloidogyne enterolobii]
MVKIAMVKNVITIKYVQNFVLKPKKIKKINSLVGSMAINVQRDIHAIMDVKINLICNLAILSNIIVLKITLVMVAAFACQNRAIKRSFKFDEMIKFKKKPVMSRF